jgi:hypothetical protein
MPREWQDASTVYGLKIVVTAPELRELASQVRRLCERYKRDARQLPDDAEPVSVVFRALPALASFERTRPDPRPPQQKRTRAARG